MEWRKRSTEVGEKVREVSGGERRKGSKARQGTGDDDKFGT